MNRALASGPIVWLGIIITTCLLLVLFQSMLWLVLPVLLAVVAYYLLSPLVLFAMSRGMTRARAVFIITILLSAILLGIGFFVAPKINATLHDLPKQINDYGQVATRLVDNFKQSLYNYLPFLKPRHILPNTGDSSLNPVPAPTDASATPPPLTLKLPPVPITGGASPAVVAAPSTASEDVENEVADLQSKYSGDILVEIAHWIPSIFLVPFITYYFLLEGPRFKRFLVQAIPNAFFEKTLYLFYRVEDQLRRYFQGLLALTALDALFLRAERALFPGGSCRGDGVAALPRFHRRRPAGGPCRGERIPP
jgi:predicted PurR-regulated permease PerM